MTAVPLVDLDIDLGELPDEPGELYTLATVVNLACGGHAGDEATMRAALRAAKAAGVRVAAHPSYADREGFGRRRGGATLDEVRRSVRAQCDELVSLASEEGLRVGAVKPHGTLYHDATSDPALAQILAKVTLEALGPWATLVGIEGGELARAAASSGLAFAREAFADRGLAPDGSLLLRDAPGALISDPVLAAEQAVRLVAGGNVDTVCVHGDTPGALLVARAVREALTTRRWLRRRD